MTGLFINVSVGDIIRYGNAVGIVLDVTIDNPSPTPGCLVKWLMNSPPDSDQDWVLMDMLEVLREARR